MPVQALDDEGDVTHAALDGHELQIRVSITHAAHDQLDDARSISKKYFGYVPNNREQPAFGEQLEALPAQAATESNVEVDRQASFFDHPEKRLPMGGPQCRESKALEFPRE